MHIKLRTTSLVLMLFAILALVAPPARADLASDLITALKKASTTPDEIEMARYFIAEPDHAAAVLRTLTFLRS